jgi:superoxide dismutase, Fe-Mn family
MKRFFLLILSSLCVFGSLTGLERSFLGVKNFPVRDFSHLLTTTSFSPQLLNMHFQLYKGYVEHTNRILDELKTTSLDSRKYNTLRRHLAWEFNGMRLHELYFENLGSPSFLPIESDLYRALVYYFGSYEAWKQDFIAAATTRGIGWVILFRDRRSDRLLNMWINEHDLGLLADGEPLLIMDVFEHAYIPQFGLNRMQYINTFFNHIEWKVVNYRFEEGFNAS